VRRRRLAPLFAALSLIAAAAPAAEPAAGLAVHGRVLGPGGVPLAGAKVALFPYEGERARGERLLTAAAEAERKPLASALTAVDGTFTLAAREAGFWTLRAEAAGHLAQELDLRPLVEERELEAVELARERPLQVAVVGPDGKPVAGAWVAAGPSTIPRYRAEETWRPPLRLLRQTVPGPVTVPRGAAERLTVRAFAPGFHEAELEVAAARKSATLALAAAGPPVPIEVRDAAGRPVAGALVVGGKGRWPLGTTGGSGRLAVPPPGAAGEEVHALAAGGRQSSARLRAAETVDRTAPAAAAAGRPAALLTLAGAGPLAGRVLDADRREPLAGALVWIGEDPDGSTRTDRAGSYRLAAVPASTPGGLGAAAPGYLPAWGEAPSGAGEERGPTFALRPAVRLRGRVVDAAAKTPLAGVEVRAAPSPEAMFTMRWSDAPSAAARTGADGRFTLRGLAAGTGYDLHLTHGGYAPKTAEAAPVEAGAVPPPLELALDRGRRGAGLVVDQSERPVAGATVTLESAPARGERRMRFPGDPEPPRFTAASDARGRFEITGLPAGRYDLTAEARGFAPRQVPGIEVAGGEGEQALGTIVLAPGTALEGQVVDPRGQPIADAGVWVTAAGARGPWRGFFRQEEEPDARSGLDGWFRVADLAPGQAVDLQVVRRGYGGAEVPGVVPPAEPVTVTLQPAVRVSGRVVDPDAKPIAGAEVGLMAERQRGAFSGTSFAGRTSSDDEGRFLFTDVDPGTLRVSARAVGRQPAELTGVQAVAGKDVADLELVLAPGAAVEGRVVDGEGRPVAGAWVRPVEDRGVRTFGRISASATTDGDGRYVLDGLPTGPRSIAAEDDQGRRGVGEIDVRAGENRLDIRLSGGAEVAGRVVDAEGAPVAGAEVMLLAGGRGWTRRQTTTGGDGGFRFEAVEDGEYRVRASKQGHATAESEPVRVAGAPVGGLEVRLQAGGAIVGRVLGLEADALARVEIAAARTQAMDYKPTRVDYEGRYRIAPVAPGEWRVWAEVPNTGRRAEGRVTLAPGASEATLDLDFTTGLTLSGRVVRGGAAVSGAYVSAQGSDVADRGAVETDRDGLFRIGGLDAGSYDVTVQSGSAILREKLALEADREVVLELAVAAVAGRVVDSTDRAPIAGAAVRLEQPEGEERIWGLDLSAVTTDAQGRFRLAEVAAGRWRLRVEREGYAAGNRELTVREGVDVEEVEVALEPTAGLVVEVVRQTGGAPSDVRLAVVDGAGRTVAGGWHETGAEGRVRLSTVPAGGFEVLVSAEGLAVGRAAAVVPGPPVRLALAPAAAVDLRVPALAGEPAVAKVTARGADGAPFRLPGWGGVVQSDWNMAAGRSRLDGLPAGAWTVEARTPDGRVWSGTVTLVPGQTAELVLE
jgi:protocatechuate 3,4-dioxygenase beta subunit